MHAPFFWNYKVEVHFLFPFFPPQATTMGVQTFALNCIMNFVCVNVLYAILKSVLKQYCYKIKRDGLGQTNDLICV